MGQYSTYLRVHDLLEKRNQKVPQGMNHPSWTLYTITEYIIASAHHTIP